MAIDSYYGAGSGTTVLSIRTEFDDGSPPIVHRSLKDQEAYDTWHLAYYFKDVLECAALRDAGRLTLAAVPHKEKYLICYLMLSAMPDIGHITELGCSVFDLIDGLHLVAESVRRDGGSLPVLDVGNYRFTGVELSEMMSRAARLLHPDHKLVLHRSVAGAPESLGFLYDRNVVSYVFETAEELASFLNRADGAYANIFFSLGESFRTTRLGKQMVYFSLAEILPLLRKPLFHLFGSRAPGPEDGTPLHSGRSVVEGFFLNCEQAVLDRFMRLAGGEAAIGSYFKEKGLAPRAAEALLRYR